MNQSSLAKGAIGTIVVGGTGTGGYLTYKNYFEKTVEQILEELDLIILNSSSPESDWKEITKVYYQDAEANIEEKGFVKKVENFDDESTINEFKDKCATTLKKKVSEISEEDFSSASRWCVKEESITQTLTNKKVGLIDPSTWAEAVKKTKDNGMKSSEGIDYDGESLRSDCDTKASKKTTDKNSWQTRNFVFKYCLKPKTE